MRKQYLLPLVLVICIFAFLSICSIVDGIKDVKKNQKVDIENVKEQYFKAGWMAGHVSGLMYRLDENTKTIDEMYAEDSTKFFELMKVKTVKP